MKEETKEEKKVELAAPWTTLFNEYKAFFAEDHCVDVKFKEAEGHKAIVLYVSGDKKAEALKKLLPGYVTFGYIMVYIEVRPENKKSEDFTEILTDAFSGNDAVAEILSVEHNAFRSRYVVFKKKVVQFYNDDLSDVNGNCSTLYQEIAKDIFSTNRIGLKFCTSSEDDK